MKQLLTILFTLTSAVCFSQEVNLANKTDVADAPQTITLSDFERIVISDGRAEVAITTCTDPVTGERYVKYIPITGEQLAALIATRKKLYDKLSNQIEGN